MKVSTITVERWVWYVFLATLALQTRLILWQADTSFIEWRSFSFYVSDACMVALFVLSIIGAAGRFRFKAGAADVLLGLVAVTAIFSLSGVQHMTVGIVQLVRLLQFIGFFYYLRYWAWNRFDAQRSAIAFVIGALLQAGIGFGQYAAQHDVGLRWLGETLLRTDMRGVAVFFDVAGGKILRAYGTLPHPNILAAYLLVAFWFVVWLWVRNRNGERGHALVWQIAIAILVVGQYLTFSRTIIAAWVASLVGVCIAVYTPRISLLWVSIAEIRRRLRVVLLTVGIVSAGFIVLFWPQVLARLTISGSDEAVRLRIMYNAEAASTGLSRVLHINWTGVGIGNFTSWLSVYDRALPAFLVQPAHNIYLLAYSEVGLLGLLGWLAWLAAVAGLMRRAHQGQPVLRAGIAVLFVAMLGVGMLDHFFWTLQQGRILWWGILALAAGRA